MINIPFDTRRIRCCCRCECELRALINNDCMCFFVIKISFFWNCISSFFSWKLPPKWSQDKKRVLLMKKKIEIPINLVRERELDNLHWFLPSLCTTTNMEDTWKKIEWSEWNLRRFKESQTVWFTWVIIKEKETTIFLSTSTFFSQTF